MIMYSPDAQPVSPSRPSSLVTQPGLRMRAYAEFRRGRGKHACAIRKNGLVHETTPPPGGILLRVLFAIFILEQCSCQPPSVLLHAAPSSAVVSNENGDVFIAAGTQLLRLSSTLTLQENVTVGGGGELLRIGIALSPNGSRMYVGRPEDVSRVQQWTVHGPYATVDDAEYHTENRLAVITIGDSFYLGSEGAAGVQGNDRILLTQYQYTSGTIHTTEYFVEMADFDRHFY